MKKITLILIAISSISNIYAFDKLKKCKVLVEVEIDRESNVDYNLCYDYDFDKVLNNSFITYETYKFKNTTKEECSNLKENLQGKEAQVERAVHFGGSIVHIDPEIYTCTGKIIKIHKIKHGRKRLFKSNDYPFLF